MKNCKVAKALNKSNVTFKSLLERFFFEKCHRAETQKGYLKVVNQLLKFSGDILPDNLSREEVILWRKLRLGSGLIKPITWNNNVTHLHALYSFGLESNLLNRKDNPFSHVKVTSGQNKRKTFLDLQLEKLDHFLVNPIERNDIPQYLQPWWFTQALIFTLRYTAIRRGQLLKLTLGDIDMKNRVICVRSEINKNHSYYEVPINRRLYHALDKLRFEHFRLGSPNDQQLFNINLFSQVTRCHHGAMSQDQLSHFFRILSQYLHFTLSPHRFRHTAATRLMKNPDNVYIVQKLLGHKNISFTLTYIQHNVDMLSDCVEML